MASILTTAESAMATLIDSMRISDGYNLDWGSTNYEDIGQVDFTRFGASALILFSEESCDDPDGGVHAGAYQNTATYQIMVRAPLDTLSYSPKHDQRQVFHKALDDLKKLFGTNDSPGDVVDHIQYVSAEIVEDEAYSGDNTRPASLLTTWIVSYSQDRQSPEVIA